MKSIFTFISFFFTVSLMAQDPVNLIANWDYKRKTTFEKITKVITSTNGYIVAIGKTLGETYEDSDGLFIVLDAGTGERKVWKKLGGTFDESLNALVQNMDGTFTLAGYAEANRKGNKAGWIIRVDLAGNIIDEFKTGDAGQNHEIVDIAVNNSGILMAIGSKYNDKSAQPWITRLDQTGTFKEIPVKMHGIEGLKGIRCTEDDQFVLLANTNSKNKRFPHHAAVLQADATGEVLWNDTKYLGGKGMHRGEAINNTPLADGYIIAGESQSPEGSGGSDIWLVKLDSDAEMVWERRYGGGEDDRATAVVELSEGGFAVLGHTWSYMARTRHSVMQLSVVNDQGSLLDQDMYPMVDGVGNEIGFALTGSNSSRDLIFAGNSISEKKNVLPITYMGAITYKSATDLQSLDLDEELLGAGKDQAIKISASSLIDENKNQYLEPGERGYISMQINNTSNQNITNLKARISVDQGKGVHFWKSIYAGALRPGQSKQLSIPVQAAKSVRGNAHIFNINLSSNKTYLTSTHAQVACNVVSPPNLIVNRSFFNTNNTSPGAPLELKIELTNIGGQPSPQVAADFHLSAGVSSIGSERTQIPGLEPNEKFEVVFPFQVDPSISESIRIGFETSTAGTMNSIKKSFNYQLENKPIVRPVHPEKNPDLIVWTSHEIDNYRTISVHNNTVNVKAIAISDEKLDKSNFSVLINGKRLQGQKMDESVLTPPNQQAGNRLQQSYSNTIRLEEGENEVKIVYQEADKKFESQPLKFNFTPLDKPNLHVLTIGVQHDDLSYTVEDASAIAKLYMKLKDDRGRGFRKVNIYPLLKKEETTKLNIQKAFLNLKNRKNIKDNDLVVVFISSHGKVINGDQYVLLPSDYDPKYEDLTTIDFHEDILRRLRYVDGNKLVFIDACHSGSAGARSFSDAAASKFMNDLINATSGMEIFASCGNQEYSYEDAQWGNGAFTKAIIEAFNNEIVEVNGQKIRADVFNEVNGNKELGSDGVITIEELKSFVQKRVPFLVKTVKGKSQNPTNKTTELLPREMGIYMVN